MNIFTECDDLISVINYAKSKDYTNENNITLLGTSQGGFVSAIVTTKLKDEITKLILLCPALVLPDDVRNWRLGGASYDVNNVNEAYEAGYKEFCKNKFNVSQKLYEEWDINNVYVECNGEYSITLKANNPLLIYDAIKELLENNPFIKTNEIEKYYSNILNKMITEDRMIIVFQVIIIFLFVKIITII